MYGWSSDVIGFIVEKVSGQTLGQFWYASSVLVYHWSYAQSLFSSSKEYITGPLGMESSFYLTPELKRRLVNLTFRDSDGGLHPWANQVNIIEQDPSKGGPIHATFSCSSCVFLTASCLSVRLHLGGVGMYSSMRDYLKILRHLMQINGKRQIAYPTSCI